jgi:hypothetical protein
MVMALARWRRDAAIVPVLAAVVIACFADRLEGAFVWDDVTLVEANRSLTEPGGLGRVLTRDLWGSAEQEGSSLYHPLPMLSVWLQVQASGVNIVALRLGNLAAHVVAVTLLFALLRRLRVARTTAACAATLFAAHPLTTEPVLWITGRHDTLGVVFALGSMLAFPRPEDRMRTVRASVSGALAACSFLSKEPYVAAPLIVGALAVFESGPLSEATGSARVRLVERFRAFLVGAAPGTLGVACAVLLRAHLGISTHSDRLAASPLEHARHFAGLLAHYGSLGATFAQGPTISSYEPLDAAAASATLLGFAVFVVAAAGLRPRNVERPMVLLGMFWFAVACAPHILSLPTIGLWGNRYGYFPLMGLVVAGCGLVEAMLDLNSRRTAGAALAVVGLVVGYEVLATRAAAQLWRDDLTLYTDSVERQPEDGRALYHLAHATRRRDGCGVAVALFARAAQLDPDYPRSWRNLAGCLLNLGRPDAAVEPATRAIALEPGVASHHYNLGAALAGAGLLDRAIDELETALRLSPDHALARDLLDQVRAARDGSESSPTPGAP